jgi:hypothetical protein
MSLAGKLQKTHLRSLIIDGEVVDNSSAGTTNDIRVMFRDKDGYIFYATGTDVPADATAGYAKGCLFIDTDVAAATTGIYVNIGTTASSNFDAVSDA